MATSKGKQKILYVCNQCGYESPKWYGKCPSCNQWNTLEEVISTVKSNSMLSTATSSLIGGNNKPIFLNDISIDDEERYHTGSSELDRVLGGGIVKGSVILLGGDPGIGKSTLLLQICQYIGDSGIETLYISGEESARQLKLRAERLNVTSNNLMILAETNVDNVIAEISNQKPKIAIVDSIQTMCDESLSSSPGSIMQVRECTNKLMRIAKNLDIPIIIVGHVNKAGAIAGPKVLEHVVDAVLYFEGERNLSYRILRAAKNRFGSTNEIGVFEMGDSGLEEVENPSMMMLSGRPSNVSGTCVTCLMEGTRPILTEIQALVTATGFGNPRRTATGFDYNRMSLILAVLEKRAGYFFSNQDAYLNIVGGLKVAQPSADLAVALSLVSNLKNQPISDDVIAFGEVGLAGEIRSVSNCDKRITEAARLGFKRCIIPDANFQKLSPSVKSLINVEGVKYIKQAYEIAAK